MDLSSIFAAIAAHNWLAFVLALAVCARTLLSSKSSFPWTISPNWQPVCVGVAGLVITTTTSLEAHATVLQSVWYGFAGFVTGGFLDGMVVAICGSVATAPAWARGILMLVDEAVKDTTGGGGRPADGGTVKSIRPTPSNTNGTAPPNSAARWANRFATAALVGVLGLIMFAPAPQAHVSAASAVVMTGQGCAWWNQNKGAVVVDAEQVGSCVLTQVMSGNLNPVSVEAACIGTEAKDLEQIVATLIDFYSKQLTGGAPANDNGQACGAGDPPYKNLPQCIPASALARLHELHGAAVGRKLAAGH